jgi:hypothetical protein
VTTIVETGEGSILQLFRILRIVKLFRLVKIFRFMATLDEWMDQGYTNLVGYLFGFVMVLNWLGCCYW